MNKIVLILILLFMSENIILWKVNLSFEPEWETVLILTLFTVNCGLMFFKNKSRLQSLLIVFSFVLILFCDLFRYESVGCEEWPLPKIGHLLNYNSSTKLSEFIARTRILFESFIFGSLILVFGLSISVILFQLVNKANG